MRVCVCVRVRCECFSQCVGGFFRRRINKQAVKNYRRQTPGEIWQRRQCESAGGAKERGEGGAWQRGCAAWHRLHIRPYGISLTFAVSILIHCQDSENIVGKQLTIAH